MLQTHARTSWNREYSVAHPPEDALSSTLQSKIKRSTKPSTNALVETGRKDLENRQNITVQHELLLPQFYYV